MYHNEIKGVILDIDGVLEFKGATVPGAIEAVKTIRQKGYALRFLTNSTLHSRRSRADKLRRSGFQVYAEEVITASYATACYLKKLRPRSCWIMLEGDGLSEFAGIPINETQPEVLVVGDNRSRFDFDHLNKALRLLLEGTKLIGMNPDLVDSGPGQIELNVGSWVNMLSMASGVEALYIGKPYPFSFELTLKGMGLEKELVIMVGDRIQTDVKGALNCGIRSALVTTGEFQTKDLESGPKPDHILESIAEFVDLLP